MENPITDPRPAPALAGKGARAARRAAAARSGAANGHGSGPNSGSGSGNGSGHHSGGIGANGASQNGAHTNGSGPGGASIPALGPAETPDLVSSLGQLLVANARLDEEIEKLKTGGPKDDEFGRFARQAVHFVDALDRILRLGRAHAESEEVAVWLKSVEAAYERLQRLLEKHDFQILDSVGQEVDLAHHDVMEYRKTTDAPHHTIIDDLQKGIRFRGKMIRDARVVVACNE